MPSRAVEIRAPTRFSIQSVQRVVEISTFCERLANAEEVGRVALATAALRGGAPMTWLKSARELVRARPLTL